MGEVDLDLVYLRTIFEDSLLKSDLSVVNDQLTLVLNTIGQKLYDTPNDQMTPENIETLKYLIMICNLLYNRTDMDKLPMDDGFYDLLLEKYKIFDPNFQVGSVVVDFQDRYTKEFMLKKTISPITFIKDDRDQSETNLFMRKQIMRENQPIMSQEDLYRSPIFFDQGAISKRTHTIAHEHPSLVGTLDKCKFVLIRDAIEAGCESDPNVKILERDFFAKHLFMGVLPPDKPIRMILELKYDGVSVEADCTNVVESARTRGDTGVGVAADITPILKDYPFLHARCRCGEKPIGVKFEAIMTKTDLKRFCEAKQYNYANCRTAIVGLFGSSDSYKYRDYITLIPLAVDRNDLPQIPDRFVEIEFLNEVYRSNGEPLRYTYIEGNITECLFYIKKFVEEAKAARPYLNFMYDGVVVSYLDEDLRERLGRENFINKYSMAIKFDPLSKMTIFRGYTYEVGQNGNITPMLHYDPVEFIGTIHTKSTGSSLKRFQDLDLHYGDMIEVTYVNDVMPYATKPDCEHNRKNKNPLIQPPTECPICGTSLTVSTSGKTLICPNKDCHGRKLARASNMLAKMNLKGFADSSIVALDAYTFKELINLDHDFLMERLGVADGTTYFNMMKQFKEDPVYDYVIMGAIGFTGVAAKKWKNILSVYTVSDLLNIYTEQTEEGLQSLLRAIPGVGPLTAEVVADEFPLFWDDVVYINSMPNVMVSKGSVLGKQIRFSGCRNKQLEEQLRKEGYDADSDASVTKKTDILLVPYAGFTSSKTKKIGEGKIVPIQDFIDDPSKFLQ